MLYFVVFIIGFLISGIWLAFGLLLDRILKTYKTQMFKPLLSALIPTIVIWLLIGDHPFHLERLNDWRVWVIAAVTTVATVAIELMTPQDDCSNTKRNWKADFLVNGIDGACMEIPQRAMMQAFILWLLTKWHLNPVFCILITALIWCAGILFQAFVIVKKPAIKPLIIELAASFVFSVGIGYVFYTTSCILLPMAAHASERILQVLNDYRKQMKH